MPYVDEHLGDRPVVGERRAEVAGEDLPEVLEVLHDDRAVVAGLVDALRELVGGQPAAERRGDRVAGRAHEEEDQRDEDEDRRDDQQEPHEEVAAERAARSRACRRASVGGGWSTDAATSLVVMGEPICASGRGARLADGAARRAEPPHRSSCDYLVSAAKRNLNDGVER